MDLNKARLVLTEVQTCFQDLKLPLVNESEKLDSRCYTNYLNCRSWTLKDGELAEILASIYIYIDYDIVELSMNFYDDSVDAYTGRLLEFINGINYHITNSYWVFYSAKSKLQYRRTQMITKEMFDKDYFKYVLKEILENGPYDYGYIKRFMQSDEDFDTVINEWLNPISIDEMNKIENI